MIYNIEGLSKKGFFFTDSLNIDSKTSPRKKGGFILTKHK